MTDEVIDAAAAFVGEILSDRQTPLARMASGATAYTDVLTQLIRATIAEHARFSRLPLLCCAAAGGDSAQGLPVAVAWNLLLAAARVLDDLQDEPPARLPAPPAIISNAAVGLIFAGLASLAASVTLPRDAHEDFCRSALTVCAGQHADLLQEPVSVDAAWAIAGAKAGEPFALGCRAGARAGGGSADTIRLCGEFGFQLGLLTQISDDLAGLEPSHPGRPSDLAAGRRTAPIAYALSVGPPSVRARLTQALLLAPSDADAEKTARHLLAEQGALEYMLLVAEYGRAKALSALTALKCDEEIRTQLAALLIAAMPQS